MAFKRTLSLLLTLVMLLGMMGQSMLLTAIHAEEAPQNLHSPGTLVYSSHNGKDFYLYADINDNGAAKRMVYASGSVSTTSAVCYSLSAAEFTGANGIKVRLYMKSAYEAVSGVGCFWLKAGTASDGKATFIYSYDHTATPGWDTGSAKENTNKWYHSYIWDAASGQIRQHVPTDVEGEYASYVLVCKQIALNAGGSAWRMVFVPASEAGAAGVYPVKLGQLTACSFGSDWVTDSASHWHACTCGAKSDEAAHVYTPASDGVNHWNECVCGDKRDVAPHEFTIAKTDDTNHWMECACGAKSGEAAHEFSSQWTNDATHHWHACSCTDRKDLAEHDYGEWVPDYAAGQQSQTCGTCGYVNVQELNHSCTPNEVWETDGEYHWHTCAQCQQIIDSTKEKHTPADDFAKDDASHWHTCSVCSAELNKAEHSFTYEKNDTQHWQKCACGAETVPADHSYGGWAVDTQPTEEAAGSRSKACGTCGHEVKERIPALLKEANYHLTGEVDSASQYFLHKSSGTGDTGFQSLHVTPDKASATKVNIVRSEADGNATYAVQYTDDSNTGWYLYINDESKDGAMDTGRTKSLRNDRTTFLWDDENNRLYQVETVNGETVRYVLAFKMLTLKSGKEELRLVAVPESELGNGAVEAKLEICHTHSFSTAWEKNESEHWHVCSCGEKSNLAAHTVTNWTVEKEATEVMPGLRNGSCDVCGYTVQEDIPATGVKTPAEGDIAYVSGVFNGVRYYYRHTASGESIASTSPYSLYVTDNTAEAIDLTVREVDGAYLLTYQMNGKEYRLYINASGAGITAKDDGDLVQFSWDADKGLLYQLEGEVKYVLALKMMDNTKTGAAELRLAAVPMDELSDTVVPAIVQVTHVHNYSEDWTCNSKQHWKECSCGDKKDAGAHTVDEWTIVKEATDLENGLKTGYCTTCQHDIEAIICSTIMPEPPAHGNRDVLSAVVGDQRYYFRKARSGESVTSTTPYSLYTTKNLSSATIVRVESVGDEYRLYYLNGEKKLYIYVNGNGVGLTTKDQASLVNFKWDAEHEMLYQIEGNVKHVLVFKYLPVGTNSKQMRVTAVPMSEALEGEGVYVAQLCTGDYIPATGDSSMIAMAAMLMVISFCTMAVLVIGKKKRI